MNEATLKQILFDLAEAYTAATEVSAATIGKRALNDNTFFARVAEGATFTAKTFDKLVQWFSENWPEGAVWPSNVERPFTKATA